MIAEAEAVGHAQPFLQFEQRRRDAADAIDQVAITSRRCRAGENGLDRRLEALPLARLRTEHRDDRTAPRDREWQPDRSAPSARPVGRRSC